jgi:hypothetical protein
MGNKFESVCHSPRNALSGGEPNLIVLNDTREIVDWGMRKIEANGGARVDTHLPLVRKVGPHLGA